MPVSTSAMYSKTIYRLMKEGVNPCDLATLSLELKLERKIGNGHILHKERDFLYFPKL